MRTSRSSAVFLAMLASPFVVFAAFFVIERLSGKGAGLGPVGLLGFSMGSAVFGAVGLMFNSLVRLRSLAVHDASGVWRQRAQWVGVAIGGIGFLLAYVIWPSGILQIASHPMPGTVMALAFGSLAAAGFAVYVGWLLCR